MHVTAPYRACGKLNKVDVGRLASGPSCGACSQPLTFNHPMPVTADTFSAVLSGTEVLVPVDFYGIPTLIAFRGGREIGRHVGLARRAQLGAVVGVD